VEKLKTRYRYSVIIVKQLVITDFKLRYQNSILGYLWTLLRPIGLFCILYVVFVKFLKVGDTIPHFAAYLLLGIVFWNYFVEVTAGGVGAIVGRGDLIRKVNFPKYIIIIAGSFSAFINLVLNGLVVAVFMIINHASVKPIAIILLPLLFLELFLFSIAVAFLLSTLFVRYRDVNYIWEVSLQGLFYATPILYPVSKITHISVLAAKIAMLNPLAQMIQDIRYLIITSVSQTISSVYGNWWIRLIPIGATLVFFVLSAQYFRKRSPYFAEEV
jgi:ABC-2 type transport system permease protein